MTWWGWVICGAILLGAELTFVSAQFYLVFVGAAAIAAGLVVLAAPWLAPWAHWALFGSLALLSLAIFRSRVYERFHTQFPGVRSGPVGETLTLACTLAPGDTGQTEFRGALWSARNAGSTPLAAGARVRIVGVSGLTLLVKQEGPAGGT